LLFARIRTPAVCGCVGSNRGWGFCERLALYALNKERSMNLVVWVPAVFALGLVSLGLCYAFVFACEVI
jgi:hypothetical protein